MFSTTGLPVGLVLLRATVQNHLNTSLFPTGQSWETFSRWRYRLTINNRHHFSTRTWKETPDGEVVQTSVFPPNFWWYKLSLFAWADHKHMLLLKGSRSTRDMFLIICQKWKNKRFEIITQSSYMQACWKIIHLIFNTTWISFHIEGSPLRGFFKGKYIPACRQIYRMSQHLEPLNPSAAGSGCNHMMLFPSSPLRTDSTLTI